MLTGEDATNRLIEREFLQWADAISLPEKLRTMRMARCESGEAFCMFVANPKVDSAVKLDLRVIEADQVATPNLIRWFTSAVDGIIFDAFGNPTEYHVLKNHPGEFFSRFSLDYDRIPASAMIHFFRTDRPGQGRGIPEITPAAAALCTTSTVYAGGTGRRRDGCDFAAVLFTDAPANWRGRSGRADGSCGTRTPHGHRVAGGWKLGQVQAQQPSTTYAEFKKEILNEIARCLNMPFNVACGNSSGYNYASWPARSSDLLQSIRVDQCRWAQLCLIVVSRWLDEAILISGFLPF